MSKTPPLERSTPEAVGIPSAAILDLVRAFERHDHPLDAVQGFILLRHGKVAAEGWWRPYGSDLPHSLFSLSKSFTSTAIGLAVAEGRLTVDDPVLGFFPDDAPAHPDANLRAMRVRHLLSMNSGHHEDTTGNVCRVEIDNWPRAFLSLPVAHEPGSWFVYNTAATYMLSAIVTELTGQSLRDYLRPRLFAPLGIANPRWETDPRGISVGGSGLHATTEDIARFGQLYLQRGSWNGTQLVPAAWIAEATRAHSDNSTTQSNPDWTVGYGYQFWRCRHNAYRADGAFGQFCVVMQEQDAVLAVTSGVRDLQAVLDKVWEHLLPAMQPEPLPINPDSHDELRGYLANLSLPLPQRRPPAPRTTPWSGVTYDLEPNGLALEGVTLAFNADHVVTLTLFNAHGEYVLPTGHGTWQRGTANLRGIGDEPAAASGAWAADDTYEVRLCLTESELGYVLRFAFAGDGLRLEVAPNVSWGATTGVESISGHAASG